MKDHVDSENCWCRPVAWQVCPEDIDDTKEADAKHRCWKCAENDGLVTVYNEEGAIIYIHHIEKEI